MILLILVIVTISHAQMLRGQIDRRLQGSLPVLPDINSFNQQLNPNIAVDNAVVSNTNTPNVASGTSGSDLTGYTTIDYTQVQNNPIFNTSLSLGLAFVIEQGLQSTLLPNATYNVSQVYSVYMQQTGGAYQQVSDDISYVTECSLAQNGTADAINLTLSTSYQSEINTYATVGFSFTIVQDSNNNNNPLQVSWSNVTGNYTLSTSSLTSQGGSSDLNNNSPSDNIYNLTGYLALGGYVNIPVDQVENDNMLYNLVINAAQQVAQNGVSALYLNENGSYTATQIYSAYEKQSVDGTTSVYRCEVLLDNGMGSTAEANYEVQSNTDGTTQIITYGFQSITNLYVAASTAN